jgi:hypothetical protein
MQEKKRPFSENAPDAGEVSRQRKIDEKKSNSEDDEVHGDNTFDEVAYYGNDNVKE